jgi:hypothetical protein
MQSIIDFNKVFCDVHMIEKKEWRQENSLYMTYSLTLEYLLARILKKVTNYYIIYCIK